MTDQPAACDCGKQPEVYRVPGSRLGLRGFGCRSCGVMGAARMDVLSAREAWSDRRRYKDGELVPSATVP